MCKNVDISHQSNYIKSWTFNFSFFFFKIIVISALRMAMAVFILSYDRQKMLTKCGISKKLHELSSDGFIHFTKVDVSTD